MGIKMFKKILTNVKELRLLQIKGKTTGFLILCISMESLKSRTPSKNLPKKSS